LKSPIENRQSKIDWGLLIVLGLMIAYSAYFSALSIQRHNSFRTYASDMGQMDQALWNTLHGNMLEDTRANGKQMPRLTDHVEPIFLVIPFVFLIYDGIESLFVAQSLALALGALPMYWIARRRLTSQWAGVIFAAMYLLFPALQAANLAEFHAVTFAPAPLLLAYNYGEERAWRRYALFSLIALAVKEDIALLVIAMGVFFAFKSKVRNQKSKMFPFNFERSTLNLVPLVIAIASFAWFLFALFVIIPHFSPRGESVYIEGRYSNPPLALLIGLFNPEKFAYVAKLLASVGFLALFDPITLLVGSPSLILNLLSSYEAQYSGTYHYSAPVAPYFVLAAIGGAQRLTRNWQWAIRNSKSKIKNSFISIPAFAVALGYHAIAGYTPIGGEFFWPTVTPHQQLITWFANQIPPDAPAMTTWTLFPHLSHRRVLYRFGQLPIPADTQFILLDVSQATTNPIDYVSHYRDALKQGFGIRAALDGYVLLQRGTPQKELPDEFYNYLRVCSCTRPANRVLIDFDNKLRFLGYDVKQDDWQRVYLRMYWTRLPGLDNNFALYPFYPDDGGAPRADAQLPDLMFPFWYPTLKWKEGEVIAVEAIPIELGARAKIGLGVFFGATWDTAEFYLAPHTDAPLGPDGKWVHIGEIVRNGKRYEGVR
jgi:uncharacterized membrane protein